MVRKISFAVMLWALTLVGAAFLAPDTASAQTCPNGQPKSFGECPDTRKTNDGQVYRDNNLQLTYGGCTPMGRVAQCELWVEVARRMPWHFSDKSYVATNDGGQLGVRDMVIGRDTMTVWNIGYHVRFVYLEPEIRTRLLYTFPLDTAPDQIQAFLIALPGRKFAKFSPEWR